MALPENTTRFGVEAPPLKRIKKTPENIDMYGVAAIDAYNSRQVMRCVGTRNKTHAGFVDTNVDIAPEVIERLPEHHWAAYRAKEYNSQDAHKILHDALLVIIVELCIQEEWTFYPNREHPQLECLASLYSR